MALGLQQKNRTIELVKLLGSKVNNTIHHPSAPGVEASHLTSTSCSGQKAIDVRISSSEHRLRDVYFLTPILCIHCKDYIWGSGKVGTQCLGKCIFLLHTFNLHNVERQRFQRCKLYL
ncbi:protein kinase C alpha type-like isoform X2 [Agrilus planipennis]|uniref:Protein kinase C alpha type-like isoform X2 n=1 Tax=Agrilus planipennis TaxID=224129 RepID=A0A7F5RAZ2_AGRPL|nr:protein kinase C alpha type-like isoform X2 [Agrilus planipennis]